jgi:hypothetical protein
MEDSADCFATAIPSLYACPIDEQKLKHGKAKPAQFACSSEWRTTLTNALGWNVHRLRLYLTIGLVIDFSNPESTGRTYTNAPVGWSVWKLQPDRDFVWNRHRFQTHSREGMSLSLGRVSAVCPCAKYFICFYLPKRLLPVRVRFCHYWTGVDGPVRHLAKKPPFKVKMC